MRLVLTILFFSFIGVNAQTFHVSNVGNDSNDGLSTETPWLTIAKANETAGSGDSVFLRASDRWNESIVPAASNIYYGAYGTGVKPVITGLQTLSGFTNVGNIWTATASTSAYNLNLVLVSGSVKGKGRTPNTGYLTFTPSTSTQIITGLSGTPNYTGGEVIIRTQFWVLDKSRIVSQSGGTLNFSPAMTYDPPLGRSYFIQNHESALDQQGEWCIDTATKVLKVYSTTTPSVQISNIDTLFKSAGFDDITIEGISFEGANKALVSLGAGANNVLIYNCVFNYSGVAGITGGLNATNITLRKDSVQNCLDIAMLIEGSALTVDSSYINNSGVIAGMGQSGENKYSGLMLRGELTGAQIPGMIVTNNLIDSTGYDGIIGGGIDRIENNIIRNYCLVKDDGAGIYYAVGTWPASSYVGTVIRKNLIYNGVGTGLSYAAGIYLDENTNGVLVDSNTIFNAALSAIYCHKCYNNTIRMNTINNGVGNAIGLRGGNDKIYNMVIRSNVFYTTSSQLSFFRQDGTNVPAMDSNYYSRPTNENNIISLNGTTYSLAEWKVASSVDVHSVGTPTGVTSDTPLFYYNPNRADSTSALAGLYLDSKRSQYNNSITLKQLTSKILYKSIIEARVTSIYKFKFRKGTVL